MHRGQASGCVPNLGTGWGVGRGAGEAGGGRGALSGWPAQFAAHVIEGGAQLAHTELLAPCCGVQEELVAQHAAHQLVLLPALDE